jgi:hypothetical protein
MKEKTINTDGRKFLLDALKLVGISRRDRIPSYRVTELMSHWSKRQLCAELIDPNNNNN